MLQFCAVFLGLALVLGWRGLLGPERLALAGGACVVLALAAWIQPAWFRGGYRLAMIASAWLGDRVGQVVLTLLFFLLITPIGWALRLCKYDPLARTWKSAAGTYWRPVHRRSRLDRLH